MLRRGLAAGAGKGRGIGSVGVGSRMRTTDCEGWSVARGYVRKTEMEREGGRKEGDMETITRSDIPRRTMRCNSLYPVEGEPPPILATKRRRLNSHDRSHYLLPRSPWRCGRRAPTTNYFHGFGRFDRVYRLRPIRVSFFYTSHSLSLSFGTSTGSRDHKVVSFFFSFRANVG